MNGVFFSVAHSAKFDWPSSSIDIHTPLSSLDPFNLIDVLKFTVIIRGVSSTRQLRRRQRKGKIYKQSSTSTSLYRMFALANDGLGTIQRQFFGSGDTGRVVPPEYMLSRKRQ